MAKKLWGGRFRKRTDPLFERFSSSLSYDGCLAEFDCLAGIAHAKMLSKKGVISAREKAAIVKGLNGIISAARKGKSPFSGSEEDVHTAVQQALKKRIGAAADKLHIARSRNDLVATDVRMYCKAEAGRLASGIGKLQKALLSSARRNGDAVVPGYTHTMYAQPVLFSHYLLAYMEMFERDKARLTEAAARLDVLPLGSGALSGTAVPIHRGLLAKELGFSRVCENSMDAVSDRDFVVEILAALSIAAMHLSRLAEDIILYSSDACGFVKIDEAYCTGSSAMPHKKNPDALELIRGETGEVYGCLMAALTMMKGLPMTYNRDMQLDKKFLFTAVNVMKDALAISAGVVRGLSVDTGAITDGMRDEFLFATDVAEYLMKKGVSHAKAHETTGRIVRFCVDKGKRISEVDLDTLKGFAPEFGRDVYRLLDKNVSVAVKRSAGGTSPSAVKAQLRKWQKRLRG